ncbi:DUF5994 family protein [Saccharopolyspora halophila]
MIASDLSSARTAEQERAQTGPRLRMKPADAVHGRINGGWWPRSRDPEVEFPELVTALRPWLGMANRVSYHLDMWAAAPRKMVLEGRAIHFEGFRSMEPHTVAVTSSSAGRLNLLTVPPDTPDETARAVMDSAADPNSTTRATELISSRSAVPPQVPRSDTAVVPQARSGETTPEERWEGEGGQIRARA